MRTVVLTIIFCGLVGHLSAGDKIKINVRQSDATIRQQLLELTPLGTPADQVYRLLQSRLQTDHPDNPVAGAPGQPFQSAMAVDLGHYGFFLFPIVVQAFLGFRRKGQAAQYQGAAI